MSHYPPHINGSLIAPLVPCTYMQLFNLTWTSLYSQYRMNCKLQMELFHLFMYLSEPHALGHTWILYTCYFELNPNKVVRFWGINIYFESNNGRIKAISIHFHLQDMSIEWITSDSPEFLSLLTSVVLATMSRAVGLASGCSKRPLKGNWSCCPSTE